MTTPTKIVGLALIALLGIPGEGVAHAAGVPAEGDGPAEPLLPVYERRSVDVQLDPTPFFLKGFAPEVGFSVGRHRFYGTAVAYEVPMFLAEDKGFKERRVIGALGYQHFFFGHVRGPFASASVNLVRSRFERVETAGAKWTTTLKSTLRLGWAVAPFHAVPELFFAPWVGPVFSFGAEDFSIDGQPIKRRPVGVSGALQVGWRFGL